MSSMIEGVSAIVGATNKKKRRINVAAARKTGFKMVTVGKLVGQAAGARKQLLDWLERVLENPIQLKVSS